MTTDANIAIAEQAASARRVTLERDDGAASDVYELNLHKEDSGLCWVISTFGTRGEAMRDKGDKTKGNPVDEKRANAIVDAIIKAKENKGYEVTFVWPEPAPPPSRRVGGP